MGFLETILLGLNFIDLAIAVGVCGFTAYSIWHTQQASPPWVWGPILGVGATFAASTLLNWFTLSCHLASCAWLLTLTIVVDLLVSTGAAIFGLLFLTQFATVAGWLRDLEADAGSQAGYPLPLDLYSHLSAWRDWIAAVLLRPSHAPGLDRARPDLRRNVRPVGRLERLGLLQQREVVQGRRLGQRVRGANVTRDVTLGATLGAVGDMEDLKGAAPRHRAAE